MTPEELLRLATLEVKVAAILEALGLECDVKLTPVDQAAAAFQRFQHRMRKEAEARRG